MRKFVISLTLALGLLGGATAAYAIKCEKCTCDLNTGVCVCENCQV